MKHWIKVDALKEEVLNVEYSSEEKALLENRLLGKKMGVSKGDVPDRIPDDFEWD